ncbi:MAG: GreA/GreB family elongation factor [Candidatus Absconditabacterales bacterium]
MKKDYLSKEGYDKLLQELNDLKNDKLPTVLERLSEAKGMGDLSENFEYKSALEDKDLITTKINQIEELLENVEIIKDDIKQKKDKEKIVDYGSKVVLAVEGEKKYTVQIVGTGEISMDDGFKISFESPIGIAIRGRKVGETVKMRLGTGRKEIKILNIE